MHYSRSTIEKIIRRELQNFRDLFNSNPERLKEIVSSFIHETPQMLNEIANLLHQEKWAEASRVVHKIKTRYGYIGLEDVIPTLSYWERELTEKPDIVNNKKILSDLESLTKEISRELSSSLTESQKTSTLDETLPLVGKKILIAEDDSINAMVFDLFVKETGASTVIAKDGIQALALAKEINPDLIFMDVHMPFSSGLEVIKKLRTIGQTCPIISLSASTRLNEKQNSLQAGANDFLIKPANRDSIIKMLLKYVAPQ